MARSLSTASAEAILLELLHSEMQSDLVRYADGPQIRRAYEQLVNLETEYRDSGVVYTCASGQHDDLGISCAMLAWAARHPHLQCWVRSLEMARRPRRLPAGTQQRCLDLIAAFGVPRFSVEQRLVVLCPITA